MNNKNLNLLIYYDSFVRATTKLQLTPLVLQLQLQEL